RDGRRCMPRTLRGLMHTQNSAGRIAQNSAKATGVLSPLARTERNKRAIYSGSVTLTTGRQKMHAQNSARANAYTEFRWLMVHGMGSKPSNCVSGIGLTGRAIFPELGIFSLPFWH